MKFLITFWLVQFALFIMQAFEWVQLPIYVLFGPMLAVVGSAVVGFGLLLLFAIVFDLWLRLSYTFSHEAKISKPCTD